MELHRHDGGVATLRFALDGPDLLAAVSTRVGGVSAGPHATLNLGMHVGDDPAAVVENRDRLAAALGVGELTVADQQHGTRVALVHAGDAGTGHGSLERSVAHLPATDGLVTDVPGAALAILVADCAPVLLHDPVRRAIGVAHAGRLGAVRDVVGATVAAMATAFGTDAADLRAAVGPCIPPERYEIDGTALAEVRAAFGDDLLTPTAGGRATFDLEAAVLRRLAEAGVPADRVERSGLDTATSPDLLYSDRAARPCGRFALVAALR